MVRCINLVGWIGLMWVAILAYGLPWLLLKLDHWSFVQRRATFEEDLEKIPANDKPEFRKRRPSFNPIWFFRVYPVIIVAVTVLILGWFAISMFPAVSMLPHHPAATCPCDSTQFRSVTRTIEGKSSVETTTVASSFGPRNNWVALAQCITVLSFLGVLGGLSLAAIAKAVKDE
ncbi:MAG: hypothetical protein NTX17_00875 [Candidatus Eisenbacteria bacterium]|nr:hypothetical protein [Candidatus Eisenbacteria bacterium]